MILFKKVFPKLLYLTVLLSLSKPADKDTEDNPDNVSKMYQVQQKSFITELKRAEILKRLYQDRDNSRK